MATQDTTLSKPSVAYGKRVLIGKLPREDLSGVVHGPEVPRARRPSCWLISKHRVSSLFVIVIETVMFPHFVLTALYALTISFWSTVRAP